MANQDLTDVLESLGSIRNESMSISLKLPPMKTVKKSEYQPLF